MERRQAGSLRPVDRRVDRVRAADLPGQLPPRSRTRTPRATSGPASGPPAIVRARSRSSTRRPAVWTDVGHPAPRVAALRSVDRPGRQRLVPGHEHAGPPDGERPVQPEGRDVPYYPRPQFVADSTRVNHAEDGSVHYTPRYGAAKDQSGFGVLYRRQGQDHDARSEHAEWSARLSPSRSPAPRGPASRHSRIPVPSLLDGTGTYGPTSPTGPLHATRGQRQQDNGRNYLRSAYGTPRGPGPGSLRTEVPSFVSVSGKRSGSAPSSVHSPTSCGPFRMR